MIWSDDDVVPGIRSQVEVTDYNGDGKLDLLVGDFYTAYDFKQGRPKRDGGNTGYDFVQILVR